jgi:hypothetical protein
MNLDGIAFTGWDALDQKVFRVQPTTESDTCLINLIREPTNSGPTPARIVLNGAFFPKNAPVFAFTLEGFDWKAAVNGTGQVVKARLTATCEKSGSSTDGPRPTVKRSFRFT